MNLKSTVTCPYCARIKDEIMPHDSCVYFYRCLNCLKTIKPKPGDCCVFCSYGTERCPPKQAENMSK